MTTSRRRQAGEGSIGTYQTAAGTRYFVKVYVTLPDGSQRQKLKRGFATKKAAAAGIRDLVGKSDAVGGYTEPSKMTVGQYLDEWLDGLRLAPSTVASYRKNVRLHLRPRLGAIKLSALTGGRLSALYRSLELEGRADGTGGLSARTVRYVATILHKAMKDAVRQGLIPVNPADVADQPSAKEARPPEMVTWTSEQLGTFLSWASDHADPEQRTAWVLLVATGMRRGEALALRWKDIDLDHGTISIRRSVGVIKTKGERQELVEGATKTGMSRVVDVDPGTIAMLKAYRTARAGASFALGRADSLVFGNDEGGHRLPESFSRSFKESVEKCVRWQLASEVKGVHSVDTIPVIHLHSLRHTSATLQLAAGVHPKIVQERLGHQTISITLDIYTHALPTMQREAATALGNLIYGG
jgi:integrase